MFSEVALLGVLRNSFFVLPALLDASINSNLVWAALLGGLRNSDLGDAT